MTTTILVVDDDADVRALLHAVFTLAGGWTVMMADSFTAAVEALESADIDVILTDNELGDGCAADVHAKSQGRPVVVLSASVDGPASTLVPLAGYAGGIPKPFNPLTLPALVESAMESTGAGT